MKLSLENKILKQKLAELEVIFNDNHPQTNKKPNKTSIDKQPIILKTPILLKIDEILQTCSKLSSDNKDLNEKIKMKDNRINELNYKYSDLLDRIQQKRKPLKELDSNIKIFRENDFN